MNQLMTAYGAWTFLLGSEPLDPVPDADEVAPGLTAFLVFLALVVVTVLLWRSMRTQMGRITVERDAEPEDGAGTRSASPQDEPAESEPPTERKEPPVP